MSVPTEDTVRPSVAEVARLIRARTKDSDGVEVGTFNEDTRPTAEQVSGHIDSAVALVMVRFQTLPDDYTDAARALVAYRAALQIEKSYFPEQVRSDRSAYDQLRQEYLDDLAALEQALSEQGVDPGPTGDSKVMQSVWTPTYLRIEGEPGWWGPWGSIGSDGPWPEPENPENWAQPLQPPRQPPQPEDLPVGELPARHTGELP
jgi:hypothetical protein